MNRSLMLSLLFVFATCLSVWGDSLPWEMKLPFKEAAIHYTLQGTQQGEEILYIKDHGRLRAQHHTATITVMGMKTATKTLILTSPEWVTTYDLNANTGSKSVNPQRIFEKEYNKLTAAEKKHVEKNSKELGTSMMQSLGGGSVSKGTADILGYPCDITTIAGLSTVYIMRGTDIPLRTEMAAMGMKHSINATTVDTTTPLPGNAFSPPAGIAVSHEQETEALMTSTIQELMHTLKRPDGAAAFKTKAQNMLPSGAKGVPEGQNQEEMMKEIEQQMESLKKMMPKQ